MFIKICNIYCRFFFHASSCDQLPLHSEHCPGIFLLNNKIDMSKWKIIIDMISGKSPGKISFIFAILSRDIFTEKAWTQLRASNLFKFKTKPLLSR